MGSDLIALIDEPLIPHLLYGPPAALNVAIFHGDVGVFQVDPEADTLGHRLPLFEVAENALPAEGIKLINTVLLNLCLVSKTQLAFHL